MGEWIRSSAFLALAIVGFPGGFLNSEIAIANTSGFVTPSEITITFTSLRVLRTDNSSITLLSGNYPTTFKKSDSDFTAVPLAGITAPAGRFIGVQICYNTDRSVKLNGDKFQGSGYADQTPLYSVGSVSTASGSISTTVTANPTTLTGYTVGNGSSNCSQSYFAAPVCVTNNPSSCLTGDTVVDATKVVPHLNILLDMYNAVGVDASANSLDNHIPVYPYPTIGDPGAAIHLVGTSGSAVGNVSLLFGSDQKLLYAASYFNQSLSGSCSGNGFVNVTAAPTGAFLNSYGPSPVAAMNTTSGMVQFAAGNAGNGNNSVSSGMVTLDNVLQAANSNATVTCVADSLATPPYLGFTYTSGAGVSGSTSYAIKRIIDPKGIFASKTGCTGTCGNSGNPYYP